LCYSEFGLHFQQVEYSSIVGLMFDIHHLGFCSQIPTYVAFTNTVVPPPVHFQRASQYPQVINTNKGQTQVQPEYYTPYNNIGHPVNPIRTTIVPTDGEYRHRQAQNKGSFGGCRSAGGENV
jgi:hypothetical protein